MKLSYKSLFLFFFLISLGANAQKVLDQTLFSINIKPSATPILVDGIDDEPIWKTAQVTSPFWMKYPRQNERPTRQTEVKVTYDNQFIYIFAVCHDTSTRVIRSLKRDTRIRDNDGFVVVLDPVNKSTYSYEFGVLSNGVQNEAIIVPNADDPDFAFDQKWFSATKNFDGYYTIEMAIPLRILHYESGKQTWGINFIRSDQKNNEFSTWTQMPLQVRAFDMLYTGALNFETAPKKSKLNGAFIPYISGGLSQDSEVNPDSLGKTYNAGFDAKVSVSTSLNLDLTFNPDFSQVDADEQQTNLTRFSLFYPERRNFFIENSDVFNGFGIPPIRPFFSRRIGLDENNRPVPILYGARLSGNISDKTRIGIMNTHASNRGTTLGENYSAAAVSHNIDGFNSIKGYGLHRQAFDGSDIVKANYGTNVGIEFSGNDKNNKWQKWVTYNHSFQPNAVGRTSYFGAGFNYNTPKLQLLVDYSDVGTGYYADMGFVARINNYDEVLQKNVRLGFRQNYISLDYSITPQKGIVIRHTPGFEDFLVFNPDGKFNEHFNRFRYFIDFKNTANLKFRVDASQTVIQFPFSFTGGTPLPIGQYNYYTFNAEGNSDARKLFSYRASVLAGSFFNGSLLTVTAGLNYRIQPWGIFEMRAEYNKLTFPEPYGEGEIYLIGPKFDISLSRTAFWTTFLQYNTQANNFNINSRFQWRYAPMSDLFVVYSDNSTTTPFGPKNRALVLKLNYWLNI